MNTQDAQSSACISCNQIDIGQTGEYPCPGCGIPRLHDEKPAHTIDCAFEHFLSYSGLHGECDEVKAKLLLAFNAGGESPATAQEA